MHTSEAEKDWLRRICGGQPVTEQKTAPAKEAGGYLNYKASGAKCNRFFSARPNSTQKTVDNPVGRFYIYSEANMKNFLRNSDCPNEKK